MRDRYSRQVLFRKIGKEGQQKLSHGSVVVIGAGGLGCTIATTLVRAGVGKVRIIDRDIIEYHNLHRQILYTEQDVKNHLPKAVAAEQHLKKANSLVQVQGIVADVNYANIEKLIAGADVVLDGLDNPETRFIINDASLKLRIPWIYGSAVSAIGQTMNIIPGQTPCFRCLFPTVPPKGVLPTCDTAGVIGPAPHIAGSLQSTEAIKILLGAPEVNRDLIVFDLWEGTFHRFQVTRRPDCPACQGNYEFLTPQMGIRTTVLCGQNAVQVQDPKVMGVSLPKLAKQLETIGRVEADASTLRFSVDDRQMVIFPDGRIILRNSLDERLARDLYVKYIEART